MKSSPRHSPRGSPTLPHITESHIVNAADIDGTKSPHAIDDRDPNYDPFDDDSEYVDFYLNEETTNLGSIPYHVVQSTKSATPAKNRFKMTSDAPELSLPQFKERVNAILEELFASLDFADCVNRIESLNCRLFHDELVAHIIRVSLDRNEDADRDVASALISLMRKSNHVSVGQLSRAFEKLFITWEDIKLDVPAAPEMILRFLELAVADSSVPSSFVARLPESFLTQLRAEDSISFPQVAKQLDDLRVFKKQVKKMAQSDLEDIESQLVGAGHAEMRHEFVRCAINASLDREDEDREKVSLLLCNLSISKNLSEDDFLWGFSHLLGSLDDLTIDCPDATELVGKFLVRAVVDELVPPSFLENAIRLGLGQDSARWAQAQLAKRDGCVWTKSPKAHDRQWLLEVDVAVSDFLAGNQSVDEFCSLLHSWALTTTRAVAVVRHALLLAMAHSDGAACMALVTLLEECVDREELKASDVWAALTEIDTEKNELKKSIPDINEMINVFGGLLKKHFRRK